VRLLGFDVPAPERGGQLHEAEVAGEAVLVAAKSLQADDADRPRAEPSLALQPACRCLSRQALQLLELERAAETHQRGAAPRAESEVSKLGRREARQVGAGRSRVEAVERRRRAAHDRPLDLARTAREDQLAG